MMDANGARAGDEPADVTLSADADTFKSILDGVPGLALGNVVGSNTANVLLVLGVPALFATLYTSECDTRKTFLFMAAATLAPHLRRRAILFGMILATGIRIVSAIVATYLYEIPWIRFFGGVALLFLFGLWQHRQAARDRRNAYFHHRIALCRDETGWRAHHQGLCAHERKRTVLGTSLL